MAVIEASVTRAGGVYGSGWVRKAVCDRLALHPLSAVVSVSFQLI